MIYVGRERGFDLGARGALLLFFRKKVTKNLVAQKTHLRILPASGFPFCLTAYFGLECCFSPMTSSHVSCFSLKQHVMIVRTVLSDMPFPYSK